MISHRTLSEKVKKLKKKLEKKENPYPPMGYFNEDQKEEIEAFSKKHPKSIIYLNSDNLLD